MNNRNTWGHPPPPRRREHTSVKTKVVFFAVATLVAYLSVIAIEGYEKAMADLATYNHIKALEDY